MFRFCLTEAPGAISSADTAVERGMAAILGVLLPSYHQPIGLCQGPERSALRSDRPKPFAPMGVTSKPVRLLVQIAHT
jgi:hypothetical protein